jgi:hypothetical protein
MVYTKPISEDNDYWVNSKTNNATYNVLVTWSSNRGAWKMYKNALLWDQGYNLAAGETIKGW